MTFKLKTDEEYLAELNSDFNDKEKFNKLSESSQITIIQRIDKIENRIENTKK